MKEAILLGRFGWELRVALEWFLCRAEFAETTQALCVVAQKENPASGEEAGSVGRELSWEPG